MIGRTSRSFTVSMLRLPKCAQGWGTRSAHASASGPNFQGLLRGNAAPFASAVHLQRVGAMLGRIRHVASIPIQHVRAMTPEANDMLSLHEGIEVDVIIEGRPLDGDRCANVALICHCRPASDFEPWSMLTAKLTSAGPLHAHEARLVSMQQSSSQALPGAHPGRRRSSEGSPGV